MNLENINKNSPGKRILIAPLNWGLGHATRCIPIIKTLIKNNAEVIIAADGPAAILLQNEFPGCQVLDLKGYGIKYSNRRNFFAVKILLQIPAIMSAIQREKKWLKSIITEHKIDAVISDNRFGFCSGIVPCVFLTHQLSIQTGNKFSDRIVQKINYSYINKFSECWVPDFKDENNLAGELSHPAILPATTLKYTGILSRFKKSIAQKKYDLLILISGPEPQRTLFENMMITQLQETNKNVALVRGLPGSANQPLLKNKNIILFNHLPADELNELIESCEFVIARSGYSSIMDLATLQSKAILIPTPGQTEQEYLAKYLMEKKIFFSASQENFSLEKTLSTVMNFEFSKAKVLPVLNETVITDWLNKIC